jgi:PAS fold
VNEAIDLTDCENEPITIPGSIQPHGILLALRGSGLTVVKASANLPLFLGVAPREMLGQPVGNGSMRRQRMHSARRRNGTIPAELILCYSPGEAPRTNVLTGYFTAVKPTSSWNWSVCNPA